jgi:hypothetical protein
MKWRSEFVGKDGLETARFVLIVQKHDGYDAQRLATRTALRCFALQVLQEAIGEMILGPLAPGIFLASSAAVGTKKFHPILLRIAVQSRPAGAAHAYSFNIAPVHLVASFDPRPQHMWCARVSVWYNSLTIFFSVEYEMFEICNAGDTAGRFSLYCSESSDWR